MPYAMDYSLPLQVKLPQFKPPEEYAMAAEQYQAERSARETQTKVNQMALQKAQDTEEIGNAYAYTPEGTLDTKQVMANLAGKPRLLHQFRQEARKLEMADLESRTKLQKGQTELGMAISNMTRRVLLDVQASHANNPLLLTDPAAADAQMQALYANRIQQLKDWGAIPTSMHDKIDTKFNPVALGGLLNNQSILDVIGEVAAKEAGEGDTGDGEIALGGMGGVAPAGKGGGKQPTEQQIGQMALRLAPSVPGPNGQLIPDPAVVASIKKNLAMKAAYGIGPTALFQVDPKGGVVVNPVVSAEQQRQRKAGATSVIMPGQKAFQIALGTAAGKQVEESQTKASAAQESLATIYDLRPILTAGIYSGPLSGSQRTVAQFAAKLGIAGKDAAETLKRTASTMQGLAALELASAAAMKGQGVITESERAILARAGGGNIQDFTAPEIQTMLNGLEKIANYRINAHEKNITRLRGHPEGREFADYYSLPQFDRIHRPSNKAEYDKLPSGARYYNDAGQVMRKR